jgi:hypothetical protein
MPVFEPVIMAVLPSSRALPVYLEPQTISPTRLSCHSAVTRHSHWLQLPTTLSRVTGSTDALSVPSQALYRALACYIGQSSGITQSVNSHDKHIVTVTFGKVTLAHGGKTPTAVKCFLTSALGVPYTISLNDNLAESFRMTIKSRMMRDPTLFNQNDIPNDNVLAQCTTSCCFACKHERCTHGWLHEKGDFVSIEPQKKSETETLGEGVV